MAEQIEGDPMIEVNIEETPADIEMGGGDAPEPETDTGATAENDLPFAEEEAVQPPARITFVDYLKSPIVSLLVGQGEEQTLLTAHQALLAQSPWFAEECAQFDAGVSTRRIDLPNEDLDAVGCFLQYIYTGEYYPKKLDGPGDRSLERDAGDPVLDTTGDQLLKHARVYTLASKLQMPSLRNLAHSKIHCVDSTAKGEMAYARFVYANTPAEDITIRKPVASFWAQRSHVLRKEAEEEFRSMCLEYPQFAFDVLTKVLDEKAAREANRKEHPAGRPPKRPRQSNA